LKLAIISDIHANIVALRAVLKRAHELGVEYLLVLGDCIGYYYNPNEVFCELEKWRYDSIIGNHEALFLELENGSHNIRETRKKHGNGIIVALNDLQSDVVKKISKLYSKKSIVVDEVHILLCHGSPWDRDEYIYPDADAKTLKRCDIKGFDFVLMGHTHYPFIFKGRNAIIANVGSVGQSRVLGGVANWAIIDSNNRSYIPMSTIFDTAQLIKQVEKFDPEIPYLSEVLKRNNS